jgi:hypothetical protein
MDMIIANNKMAHCKEAEFSIRSDSGKIIASSQVE